MKKVTFEHFLGILQRRFVSGIGPGVNVRSLGYPIAGRTPKIVSVDEAVKLVKSGSLSRQQSNF